MNQPKKGINLVYFGICLMVFIVFLILLSILIGFAMSFYFDLSLINISFVFLIFLIVIAIQIITIFLSWQQVPEREEWLIEWLGKYFQTWQPGLHFLFPFFHLMTIRSRVFMGEQQMKLFMDERVKIGYGAGHIDFIDASAPVHAVVYLIIVDSYKATYNITNVFRAIGNTLDSAVRSYLGHLTIDQAIKFRAHLGLGEIMNGDLKVFDFLDKGEVPPPVDFTKTDFYQKILNDWGMEITGLAITDIQMSPEVIKMRQELLRARKEAEAAIEIKKAVITQAESQKESLKLLGEGHRLQIEQVAGQDLGLDKAAAYLLTQKGLEAVKPTDKTLLITPGIKPDVASLGAAFGLGQKAVHDSDQIKKESEVSDSPDSKETKINGGE